MERKVEYTIAGKSNKDGRYYLIYTCGPGKKHAEKVLDETKNDEKLKKEYDDFIIQEHVSEDCWWNRGTN